MKVLNFCYKVDKGQTVEYFRAFWSRCLAPNKFWTIYLETISSCTKIYIFNVQDVTRVNFDVKVPAVGARSCGSPLELSGWREGGDKNKQPDWLKSMYFQACSVVSHGAALCGSAGPNILTSTRDSPHQLSIFEETLPLPSSHKSLLFPLLFFALP